MEGGACVNEPNDVSLGSLLSFSQWLMHCDPVQNEFGQTALITACKVGHIDTARVLLDHGAIIDFQDKVIAPASVCEGAVQLS